MDMDWLIGNLVAMTIYALAMWGITAWELRKIKKAIAREDAARRERTSQELQELTRLQQDLQD
jgi:hypothetical protein